jgi:hypothetical protein
MKVKGLSKELRTFQIIWAIGTMFGATQKVDMVTTNKNCFGRLLVAVLNSALIPNQMDVVIGDRIFQLKLEVEMEKELSDAAFIDTNQNQFDKEDDANGDNSHSVTQDDNIKRAKSMSQGGTQMELGNEGAAIGGHLKNQSICCKPSSVEMEALIQFKVDEILDMAFEKVLGDCANRVLAEEEDLSVHMGAESEHRFQEVQATEFLPNTNFDLQVSPKSPLFPRCTGDKFSSNAKVGFSTTLPSVTHVCMATSLVHLCLELRRGRLCQSPAQQGVLGCLA